jgi:pimeloyl-ACP methyl ester carboxylesterase
MPQTTPLPDALRALAATAQRIETPSPRGAIVWHVWGDGPPLLLMHGGSGSWMHWARNIEHLAQTHRVLAVDTPGLGQSAKPPRSLDIASYAQTIVQGLEAILGPSPRLDIAAFSFGTIVAGQIIGNAAVEVRKLVLVGPAALGVSKLARNLVKVRHLDGKERWDANFRNLAILMFADPAAIDETAVAIQDWNSRHARIDSRSFARATSLKEALIAWNRPFAWISGEKDATSQPPLVGPVLRAIRPDLDARILGGIGHWCQYEGAEEFNRVLSNVLARL